MWRWKCPQWSHTPLVLRGYYIPISSSFNTIWVSIMRISHVLIPVGYGCYWFQHHSNPKYMQVSSYLGQVALVSIWFRMLMTQTTTHLEDTHQISIFDWYYNFDTNRVSSLIPLLMSIIDTLHSPTHWSKTGTYRSHKYVHQVHASTRKKLRFSNQIQVLFYTCYRFGKPGLL